MTDVSLKECWNGFYQCVPAQLQKIKNVRRVATAFNTNIDAVVKISGARIAELAKNAGITAENMSGPTQISNGSDVVRGIVKCFTQGIAEEWLCGNDGVFDWLKNNIGYDRLQMGGQGGIVANAMAVLGVRNVYVHTASHPKLQAEQFLDADNLFAASDKEGNLLKAREVNRMGDLPLIHWIIEFDVGDKADIGGKEFVCPKSNRFIATYDPDNMQLKKDEGFLRSLERTGFDYMILSGYHNLTDENGGVEMVKETIPLIKKWKENNPQAIIHLELASTQDIKVRSAIMEYIAPLADSAGMNEREALDILEITDKAEFTEALQSKLDAPRLFDILLKIKEKYHTPRLQLHFFGMYVTLQDRNFKIRPEQNKRGMMLAATVAATKAGTGNIDSPDKLLWAHGRKVSEVGLGELEKLANYIGHQELAECGICDLEKYEIIAVPTILIEKPLTLVGMGDTISSISLTGAL